MKTENFGYKKLYIHGQLVDAESKKRGTVVCPATGETIAEIAIAGVKDTEKVLESSQKGFKAIAKYSLTFSWQNGTIDN